MAHGAHLPFMGWNEIVNVGDQVIADVVDNVFGYKPLRVGPGVEHLLGIGSLFFMANARSHIWGSGVLTANEPIPQITATQVHALRGTLTADRLTREGYHLPDMPFGDPGVLVAEYIRPSEIGRVPGEREILIIPHHSTFTGWAAGPYAHSTEVEIIDPCTNKAEFLRRMLRAEIVITESLHGLIFASAFGRKAVWVGNEDADHFKYHDWFTTVDAPPTRPFSPKTNLSELVAAARAYPHRIRVDELRRSFPHQLAARLDGVRISYDAARDQNPFVFFFQDHHRPLAKGKFSPVFCWDLAASLAEVIFSCWDDRPYAIGVVHHHGILPNKPQLDRILFEMDHHLQHHIAVIATKEQAARAGLVMHAIDDKVSWAVGDIGDVSTVLIRPSGTRRSDDHVVFCV